MPGEVFNANPIVFSPAKPSRRKATSNRDLLWTNDVDSLDVEDDGSVEPIDNEEIFELVRSIYDPEYRQLTLEDLAVVSAPQIRVDGNNVLVEFTPTVPHCGMSALIGLAIRVQLLRSLPARLKVDVRLKPGSHVSEQALNRQFNDKERIQAAIENPALLSTVEECLTKRDD